MYDSNIGEIKSKKSGSEIIPNASSAVVTHLRIVGMLIKKFSETSSVKGEPLCKNVIPSWVVTQFLTNAVPSSIK